MNRALLFIGSLLWLAPVLSAQTLHLKTGKVVTTSNVRREANFLFAKITGPDGAPAEEVVPIQQVDRIEFGEVAAVAEARKLALEGNTAEVLEKTAALITTFRPYAEIPGSPWPDIMRLRLPAVAVSDSRELWEELQKTWVPTGDSELDTAFRLLAADPAGAKLARKALAVSGAGSLAAGLSWLALGEEALAAKAWKDAIRAFLSVEVYLPHHPLLQPRALLGAARAYQGNGETGKAAAMLDEVKSEYPKAPEASASLSEVSR